MRCTAPARRAPAAAFDTYLREINEAPLLRPEQEGELARRVAAGDAAARDRLVRANLRLVVAVARRHAGRGVPLEDLVAEGNLGLIRAAELFDPERGARFSTYAVPWITQSIRHHLAAAGRPVRLPYYLTLLLARWGRAAAWLREGLGRPPAEEEVAVAAGLSPEGLRRSRAALRAYGGDGPPGAGEGPGVESLPDRRAQEPWAALAAADEVRKVRALLEGMEPRRATVLRLRFGLAGGAPQTLQEIADVLGVTRETVRRLEMRGLEELAAALGGR
jgi:RNA polymerase primary sigma factor